MTIGGHQTGGYHMGFGQNSKLSDRAWQIGSATRGESEYDVSDR